MPPHAKCSNADDKHASKLVACQNIRISAPYPKPCTKHPPMNSPTSTPPRQRPRVCTYRISRDLKIKASRSPTVLKIAPLQRETIAAAGEQITALGSGLSAPASVPCRPRAANAPTYTCRCARGRLIARGREGQAKRPAAVSMGIDFYIRACRRGLRKWPLAGMQLSARETRGRGRGAGAAERE